MLKVFLDANIFFAGFVSPQGASSVILKLAHRGKFRILASRIILKEAERNLRKKAGAKTVKSFYRYLKQTKIHIIPSLSDKALSQYESCIYPKDVPVLAAAIEAKVNYLVTLDRRHFLIPAVLTRVKKIKILTPGEFLNEK